MDLMLNVGEGTLTTCSEVERGSLALLFAHSDGFMPVLIVELDQARRALSLHPTHEWRMIHLDHQTTALNLGKPVVRYSPGSRRPQGHEAVAGDLVFAAGRCGIRASSGYANGFSSWQTPVAWLDGTGTMLNHGWQDHVFDNWQLGFQRNEDFVELVRSKPNSLISTDAP